ncbi:MAG: glycosyltransferase [Elusimicrobia bacterium]|nr:glycosyltransferase [Elusimicrobiota bacterium]
MNIALVLPNLAGGGAEKITLSLARHFRQAGHTVRLILFSNSGELQGQAPPGIPIVDLQCGSARRALFPLLRAIDDSGADTVFSTHKHTAILCELSRFRPRGRSYRHFMRIPNTYSREMRIYSLWKRALLNWGIRWALTRADGVIGVSEGVTDDLVRNYALPRERARTIRNPVYDDSFSSLAARPSGVPRLDHREGFNVVAAGRLEYQKGFDFLIAGFAMAFAKDDAHLFILGDGPLRRDLAEKADRFGIAGQVTFPGFVLNPLPYYALASAFVLSSRFEGSPNALIQNLCLGTPVIATNCESGPAEILQNGRHGTLVPVDDVNGMAHALRAVRSGNAKQSETNFFRSLYSQSDRCKDYEQFLGRPRSAFHVGSRTE